MTPFMIPLDSALNTPLYEQIYRYIVGEIHGGGFPADEKLPSKRALCAHLGVSRNTVETAYSLLMAEGYIRSEPRSGYYVCPVELPEGSQSAWERATHEHQPLKERGDVLDFSTSDVDTEVFPLSTWSKILRDVTNNTPTLLKRGDRRGDIELRRALQEFLSQYRGVKCTAEQILVGAGMEVLIDALIKLLGTQGAYAIEDPGYRAAAEIVRSNGGEIRYMPLDAEGLRIDALEASDARCVYVTPSHQFPMGVTLPIGRRAQLLRWAARSRERYIIEDDYDSEFRYASRPIPAMQGLDAGGRVIYIGTFSRSIAPSIRLAYLVLPAALMEEYTRHFSHLASTVSRFEQQTLARFIQSGGYGRHLRRVSLVYKRRSLAVTERLREISGMQIQGDGAGLHFTATHPALTEEELIVRADQEGVAVRGLSEYARCFPPKPNTVVLGYAGLSDAQAEDAAFRLLRAWRF